MPSAIETDGGLQCNLCFDVLGFKSSLVLLKSDILYVNDFIIREVQHNSSHKSDDAFYDATIINHHLSLNFATSMI